VVGGGKGSKGKLGIVKDQKKNAEATPIDPRKGKNLTADTEELWGGKNRKN